MFFTFSRQAPTGKSLPAWLSNPGPVLLRKFVRSHKNANLVETVDLQYVNPMYARVRFADGHERNVSLRDLAPCPSVDGVHNENRVNCDVSPDDHGPTENSESSSSPNNDENDIENPVVNSPAVLRRSNRCNTGVPPVRYGQSISNLQG